MIGRIAVIYTVMLCSVLEDRSYCCNIYGCVVFGVGTRSQPCILQQYDRSWNTGHNIGHIVVYVTVVWPIGHIVVTYTVCITTIPILEHRTQHNRIYYNNCDRSSNTEQDRSYCCNNMTVLCSTSNILQHNRIYYNNMTDLQHRTYTTVYITTIWPILEHRTQHNRIYCKYDRSSNTEHNTTVYIGTIWPIFQHLTQHNRIYYNNMTDLPTPNTTQPYILQQYDRSCVPNTNNRIYCNNMTDLCVTEHNTTVYIVTIWPIFQHRVGHNRHILQQYDRSSNTEHGHNRIYYNNVTDLPTPNTVNRIYCDNMTDLPTPCWTQPYILQQYDRSSNTVFHNRIYCNNMTDLPTPNTTQPYIL